ncbi:MAG: 2-oxo acid dehydrogenase subunit E2 [Saprospiraceae bacterium]|nr:2-oxo acid dehydrogenase subunit E2 [Saprospiraceae bacterium]
MADFQLVMPKMGESIMEATILKWHKKEGDQIEVDDTILEIATDKVDSEIPSPVSGKLVKVLFEEDEVVEVGKPVAVIQTVDVEKTESSPLVDVPSPEKSPLEVVVSDIEVSPEMSTNGEPHFHSVNSSKKFPPVSNGRFYSPLVRKIAQEEGLTLGQLDEVEGSGLQGRVTKKDILNYIDSRLEVSPQKQSAAKTSEVEEVSKFSTAEKAPQPATRSVSGEDEIIEMDRMRKIIAEHMVQSKRISAHVTSFVEADVTELVQWRENNKNSFLKDHGTKLTFTPIFIQAVVKAIADFPMVNISIEDNKIIVRKNINIGMATALPSGNLIVPVIKDADDYSLVGLAKKVNDLADRARKNELKPQEINGGTFTLTNVGIFGNVMGTPIINQPQVAILATGAIQKKPAVVETKYGDLIAVRHMMFLSMSYDHRVVDGFLGGSFLRRVADYLEQFNHDEVL